MADTDQAVELPALKVARDLLAHEAYPDPVVCLVDLDPVTATFYVEQWAYALLGKWNLSLAEERDSPDDVDGQIATMLQSVAEACGMLDAALVLLGVLPDEAVPE